MVGRMPQHSASKLSCLPITSARSCPSSISLVHIGPTDRVYNSNIVFYTRKLKEITYLIDVPCTKSDENLVPSGGCHCAICVLTRQFKSRLWHDMIQPLGVFDWASSVTYVLTDWTFLTSLYSTGTGNEAM